MELCSLTLDYAIQQNILVPWRKNELEAYKPALYLLTIDNAARVAVSTASASEGYDVQEHVRLLRAAADEVPGADLLSAAPESQYIEWHQVYKIGQQYVLLYEGYNGGTRWGADVATSASLTSGWKKAPVTLIDQRQWPGYADETLFHMATPAIYQFRRKWYLYFQGAHSGYYIKQHWALWGMAGDDVLKRIIALP